MSLRIGEAIYSVNGNSIVITPADINKENYRTTYRGRLFCPYPGCFARLSYIAANIKTPYFRTWKHDDHDELCPYAIDREEIVRRRLKHNPDYTYALSDEHVDSVLKRAHDLLQGKAKSSKSSGNKQSISPSGSKSVEYVGTAAMLYESDNMAEGREMNVYIRRAENLEEIDAGKVRCIIGKVKFMWLHSDYAYINLQSNDRQVKIHFNEAFKESNPTEFSLFHHVQRYINENEDSICCCIGKVYHTSSGYDIRPDRFGAFSINQKKLYAIVNDYVQLSLNLEN